MPSKAKWLARGGLAAVLLAGAGLVAVSYRYGEAQRLGAMLALAFSVLNAAWTGFRMSRAMKGEPDALGNELMLLLMARMGLFGGGLMLCYSFNQISSAAFGVCFIVLFFVFEVFEVLIAMEWNKTLDLQSQGKAENV